MQLNISNVINISVSQAGAGAGEYNTSNLACFTNDTPGGGFGSLGYKLYVSAADVATDFGSTSKTYLAALKVFSQQPNILANSGKFIVISLINEVQTIAFSGIAASGDFKIQMPDGVLTTAQIDWDDTASEIQTKIRALAGYEQVTVSGSIAAQLLTITYKGVYGNLAVATITDEDLLTGGSGAITTTVAQVTAGETLAAAITRASTLVQFFGIGVTAILDQTDLLAAAAVIQAMVKIGFFVGNDEADIAEGGKLDRLRTNSYTRSRGLFYDDSDDQVAMDFQWAYAGRGLSVVFSGSNTTLTMHLKDLIGIDADPNITQSLLEDALAAGVDVYASFQGVPKVFCSGENSFFDQIYNLLWFVGALQIAGFNLLAQTSTKIVQTEAGMDSLKGAYRAICEEAVTNQYLAPGAWNSPDTFGIQNDFYKNISQRGYYIYSQPISQQSAAARADREAPLIQIAIKEAGAIHSSSVIVYVNP